MIADPYLRGYRAGVCGGGIPVADADDQEYRDGYADGRASFADIAACVSLSRELGHDPPRPRCTGQGLAGWRA